MAAPARLAAALLLGATALTVARAETAPLSTGSVCTAPGSGVPAARLRAMARGFNLTGWLDRKPATPPDEDALRALRARGFTHVRLPLKTEHLSPASSTPAAVEEAYRELSRAVDLLLELGFAVTLDMHPGEEVGALRRTDPDGAFAIVEAVWRRVALAFAGRSPDRVFLELFNEPSSEDEYRRAVRLAGIVRALAPRHTLVIGPAQDQRVEALEALTPLPDRNVVYAMHFYDPMAFTHQGLDWSGPDEPLSRFKGVPFPSTPKSPAVLALHDRLTRAGETAAAASLLRQLGDPWNEAAVEKAFARAAAWAARTGSAVIVNEFGVLGWHAPAADRARWLAAVRAAAERHCIGWTHWDYADGFGFMRRARGRETPDPAILDALLPPRP
jgi:endoglucanase